MKNTKQLLLLVVLAISMNVALAQIGKPLPTKKNQPVLVDDKDAASLKAAQVHFDQKRTAATSVWKQLTTSQKRNIYRIEANRDKELRAIDAKKDSVELQLKAMKSVKDKVAKEKSISEIARLTAERQKAENYATKKIRMQLTPKQRVIYNRYQSK